MGCVHAMVMVCDAKNAEIATEIISLSNLGLMATGFAACGRSAFASGISLVDQEFAGALLIATFLGAASFRHEPHRRQSCRGPQGLDRGCRETGVIACKQAICTHGSLRTVATRRCEGLGQVQFNMQSCIMTTSELVARQCKGIQWNQQASVDE